MKILCLDIETVPNLAYVWGLYDQNIAPSQVEAEGEMLCFAAKWLGDKKTEFYSVHKDGKQGMVEAIWRLLDEADVVMHWNGKRFDIPWINREFLDAGLAPPSPFRQLDLLTAVRKVFKFPSYKLEFVARALGVGAKVSHTGFDLWLGCMAGDEKSWRLMEKYNRQDTNLLQHIYYAIQAWIPQHPSHGAFVGKDVCPNCGSDDLERRGFAHTDVSTFQQYRCKECGKWSRSTKRTSATTIREVNVA